MKPLNHILNMQFNPTKSELSEFFLQSFNPQPKRLVPPMYS